ncbi:MAG TPA: hypothetical protein VHS06_05190 [Chloroflexota bacterium]|nr:hypothetical protein [Chloroflexota bacterium]
MASALQLVRQHRLTLILLNVGFFSLVALGTIYAFANPSAQQTLIQTIVEGFGTQPLNWARDAYLSRSVPAAAAVTFAVNSLLGSFLSITVTSLLIPFLGVAVGFYRALVWGLALAPTSPELAWAMIPHSVTLVLEGEGYILAMFGVHLLWQSAFKGLQEGGPRGLLAGYKAGLRANLHIYILVLLVLAVAAIYEAVELIYIVAGSR